MYFYYILNYVDDVNMNTDDEVDEEMKEEDLSKIKSMLIGCLQFGSQLLKFMNDEDFHEIMQMKDHPCDDI